MKSELPPCPNTKCHFHNPLYCEGGGYLRRDGYYRRATYPYQLQRYRCRNCSARLSETTFTIEWRSSRRGLSNLIFRSFCEGSANRQIARNLGIDEKIVRNRLGRLGQQAIAEHAYRTRHLRITEPIAYDGVENFAKSQYEPNNINQAIGFKSYFIYDFNFAPLNRKGKNV